MMSVLKHSDPADRTSVTAAAAQSDINEPLENLTQAIIALTAQIQSLENQFIMAQTARAQSFEDQVVTGLSARIMQALEDRITALVGASSDSQAPVEPLAQMVQCEGNDGALSNSQADENEPDGQEFPSPPSRLVKPESPTVPAVQPDFSKPERKRARYS
ncbi:MAG: hypothetical protein LQ339_002022 [Xanthoria mediterranea]|nr:MAG: hypothetical protein LQ339_002022 [Xanthoria mediterranea]